MVENFSLSLSSYFFPSLNFYPPQLARKISKYGIQVDEKSTSNGTSMSYSLSLCLKLFDSYFDLLSAKLVRKYRKMGLKLMRKAGFFQFHAEINEDN